MQATPVRPYAFAGKQRGHCSICVCVCAHAPICVSDLTQPIHNCRVHAGVLELLNCLLSAGEIPGLFTAEELARDMAALDSKRVSDPHYQAC